MALNQQYGELYEAQRAELMEALKQILSGQDRSFGARGVSGRARSEAEGSALDNLLRQLSTVRGGLGAAQLGREQQVSDVAGQRAYQTKMTYADWAQREKEQNVAFQRQKELIAQQQAFQQQQAEKAKKEARKSALQGALVSAGIGAATGGLFPAAMGAGAGNWLGGLGRGALMGAPAAGQMLGMYPAIQSQQSWSQNIGNMGQSSGLPTSGLPADFWSGLRNEEGIYGGNVFDMLNLNNRKKRPLYWE